MGVSNSKAETCEPLRLCKERKRFMKQAIDSRYNLAAAHVVYVQSLHNIGIAIGKFAEPEVSLQSSSPPSPAQIGTNSANNSRLNYMKSGAVGAVTVNLNPSKISNSNKVYVDDVESSPLTMPPPPPPPRFSWDYFDPTDGSFRLMSHDRFQVDTSSGAGGVVTPTGGVAPETKDQNEHREDNMISSEVIGSDSASEHVQIEQCDSEDGCLTDETEDSSEFIPHTGKDFVSSIKDIEDYFIRASKLGNEISRMLEANQIQISYSEANGSSSLFLSCFRRENTLVLHEPSQTTKVITWKRSMSPNTSSLHLSDPASNDDNEHNFIQEFCMIAGSHSSTLDRLYAWERKLYDEVKASESIRKEYDRKCNELRHQFAKDLKPHLIDKTRSVVKDLHSRMKVALHTVNSISKRIETMRDEELQPQLMELIQGLTRMWKSMLECHHAQYITISSASHSKNSRTRTHLNETKNETIMVELEHEVECLGSSFSDLVKSYTSYVESINNWLQNCIIQPKERVKGRRAFSPRRAVAPPIFVVCRDWSAGIRTLPSQKLSDVIKEFLCHIRRLCIEEVKKKELSLIENGEEEKKMDVRGSNLSMIHGSLTKVLDRLTSYCEESLKMYEEIKEKSESAGNRYSNYGPPPRPSIV